MKRIGNVRDEFLSFDNFDKAERRARKNKGKSKGVLNFDKKHNTAELRNEALRELIKQIASGDFKSTPPSTFERMTQSGKVRNISVVPYFPDVVYAHAILRIIEKRFDKNLIYDVYSYNRGVHLLAKRLEAKIQAWPKERKLYALKLDISKFYESIDREMLKHKIDKLVKDKYLKRAIYDIIDTHDGLTIGMLLSQLFSSVYLSDFDHFLKENVGIKHYYRYADDMLILSDNKSELQSLLYRIRNRLYYEFGLSLKCWQVFDIKQRPLDFVGFIFHRTHTFLRQKTKKNFAKRRRNSKSIASYKGMLKYCDGINLYNKIINENNYAKERSIS